MLNQSSSKKHSHIVWDEDNLKMNAEIQKEYSAVKIEEPKTPYRPPLLAAELAEEEMLDPLELDPDDPGAAEAAKAAVTTAFEYVMRNGGAAYTPPGPSHRRRTASSSHASDAADCTDATTDGVGAKHNSLHVEPCTCANSSGSGDCADAESAEKKRRFAELRKQHYNMKQALQQAKHLLASEDEDAEIEPEHEEADTADWKAENGTATGSSHADQQQQRGCDADDEQQQDRQQPTEALKQRCGHEQADGNGVQDMDAEQQTG